MYGITEQFTEIELSFLMLSLDEFETRINELRNHVTRPDTLDNIELNLGFIADTRRKLHNKEHDFTLNEAKVIYSAVYDRRDFINESLDEGFDSEDDHSDALSMLRIANSVLRKLKVAFSSLGIDIDAFLGTGSTC